MNKNNITNSTNYSSAFKNSMGNTFNKVRKTPKNKIIFFSITIILIVLFIAYFSYSVYKNYNNTQANEPWIIPKTRIARQSLTVPGHVIKRSNDGQYGIEFTYAFWTYITDWTYKPESYKHVFHKGAAGAMPLQAPGVWLYPRENKMAINMNTYHSIKESCDIGNIPIGKWFHTTISVIGRNMDVYINGRLKKRCKFIGLPKQNYGDLHITNWNGFEGFLSKFRYFNYSVKYWQVEKMVNDGPSKAPCTETGVAPPYLSKDYWFSSGFPDAIIK